MNGEDVLCARAENVSESSSDLAAWDLRRVPTLRYMVDLPVGTWSVRWCTLSGYLP